MNCLTGSPFALAYGRTAFATFIHLLWVQACWLHDVRIGKVVSLRRWQLMNSFQHLVAVNIVWKLCVEIVSLQVNRACTSALPIQQRAKAVRLQLG